MLFQVSSLSEIVSSPSEKLRTLMKATMLRVDMRCQRCRVGQEEKRTHEVVYTKDLTLLLFFAL
jgi:hypothetical protein